MERKRILLATAVFPPEPVVSASLMMDLAKELSESCDVTVLRPIPTRPLGFKHSDMKYPDNINVVTLENSYTCPESSLLGRLKESLSFGKSVAEYIEDHQDSIDLIYNAVWPLYGKNIVGKVAVKHGIKYVMSVQDIYPESILAKLPKSAIVKWIINGLFLGVDTYTQKNACAIHTISDGMADYLSKSRKIDRSKYHVVRNWQNESEFISYKQRTKLPIHDKTPFTFMYLGNVGPLAGLETVINAFKKAKLDARLVIAGSGSAKSSLKELAKGNSNIEFWDVPNGEVPATQDKADIMVLPIKKGFASSSIPSKLPAYMFSSKPVLCSVDSESDTAKCVHEAGGGWIVQPENSDMLATEMKKCMNISAQELKEMGKRNFNYSINNFSREKGVKKLAKIFLDAINQN